MQLLVIASQLLFALSVAQSSAALRFTSIGMPALVQRNSNFWLACQFALEPGQQLYSVKWYKNNEEFYRLLAAPAATSGLDAATASSGGGGEAPGRHFQRQYFTQLGVNVLMSASNATHVRLLNASLESEGAYACEISSENLSTIRHEREIKVYVLPHARLSVIGLRNSYALGERVELLCASDFSRPIGALAWFINGQRITQGDARHNFELQWRREAGEQAAGLQRASLALKFKLTDELLLLAGGAPDANQGFSGAELRNQSLRVSPRPAKLSSAAAIAQQQQQLQQSPVELLRLECRAKLVDVSDVTFSELKVARPAAAASERRWARAALSRTPANQQANRSGAAAAAKLTGGRPLAAKSQQGQRVLQAARVGARSLRQFLAAAAAGPHSNGRAACRRGPLALQLEDPIILTPDADLEAPLEMGATDGDEDEEAGADGESQVLARAEGAALNLNCSTLGALLESQQPSAGGGGWLLAPMRRKLVAQAGGRLNSLLEAGEDNDEPSARAAEDNERDNDHHALPSSSAEVCADLGARRRALISGKEQARAELGEPGARGKLRNPQQQQQQQLQVAYVKLSDNFARAADSAGGQVVVTKSLAQLEGGGRWRGQPQQQQQQQQQRREQFQQQQWQFHELEWRAPPLLEWFINNQEAPKSSASYSPELPLKATRPGRQASEQVERRRLVGGPPGGGSSGDELLELAPADSALLPSVDYAEYFANFDAARPLGQQLPLSLKLDKRHFMTPDSLMTLRCASTQAQVLAIDAVGVSFVALQPAGEGQQLGGWSGQQASAADARQRHWQQRPAGGAGAPIKSKHLHQAPGQKFGGKAANTAAAGWPEASSSGSSAPSSRLQLALLIPQLAVVIGVVTLAIR